MVKLCKWQTSRGSEMGCQWISHHHCGEAMARGFREPTAFFSDLWYISTGLYVNAFLSGWPTLILCFTILHYPERNWPVLCASALRPS